MPSFDRLARVLVIPLGILVLVLGALLLFGDDDDGGGDDDSALSAEGGGGTVDEGGDGTGTADDEAGDGTGGDSTVGDGGGDEGDGATAGTATTGSSTTVAETTTTTAPAGDVPELDLPPADQSAPPQEPFGIYQQGKLTLVGSVPSEEVALGYLRKAGGVIGEENVAMQMTVDPRVSGQTLTVDVNEQFRFPSGQVTFDPEFEALLNLGVAALQLLPESTLVITGHTDDVGDAAMNQALSEQRAQVVVDFMVQRGVPPERIVARGAGETQPIAPNDTPEGRAANRRIEATLEGITPE